MSSTNRDNLAQYFRAARPKLISATQGLVSCSSANPPGDVSSVAAQAATLIQALIPSATISTHQSGPGIVNVVAVLRGSNDGPSTSASAPGKRLIFSGHLDTYPIGDAARWTVPPLEGRLSDDGKRLYGRGAADMKGGIAASMVAMSALEERKGQWSGEAVLALAGDEETMGTLGSGYLLDHVDVVRKGNAMICGDAGSPRVIRIGEKGLVWVEMSATGKSSHGAHVHKGVNAIERIMEAVKALKSVEDISFSAPEEVTSAIDAAMAVSEPLSGQGEAHTLKRVTVNIGSITGGTSPNLVPDNAHAAADIRLPMGTTAAELEGAIEQRLSGLAGVTYKITRKYDPSWTAPAEEIVQASLRAARSVIGSEEVVVNMRVGASDSRLFRQRGIPTAVVGLTPFNMGGPDEYLDVDELCQVAEMHARIALDFLKI